MEDYTLGVVEARFADIIWENEPLTTKELVDLCALELNWKRTTTYTVLKKLCEKGFFQTEGRTVTSLVSKLEYNSLPALVVAFGSRKKLSDQEIEELQRMIDSMRG